MYDWVYDIEVYPNVFTIAFEHVDAPFQYVFEISEFRNDAPHIIEFVQGIGQRRGRMIGFNNLGYDYPVLHLLLMSRDTNPDILYRKSQSIIKSQDFDKFTHLVRKSDVIVPQIDLYKIHHFDNISRATSLKVLEFNMRSDNIEDLPFEFEKKLTQDQIETLKIYNTHDVRETKKFYHKSIELIKFREELTAKYDRDFMNHNDTKIGKDYFVMELENAGVQCWRYVDNKWRPVQTHRGKMALKDAILPSIQFKEPEFQRILDWFKNQVISETKGVFKNVTATVGDLEFVFGTGGIHGSVNNRIIESDDDHIIIDLDVSSYYPNLAIVNRFYPEHLTEKFCDIYQNLYETRKKYPKGTAENAMLKLALNGTYGDSNNVYSPFYDPLFTMKITLNGQLQLCLLAEMLLHGVPGIELIQVNTDGITVRIPRNQSHALKYVKMGWEKETGLELEESEYNQMFIRDVNNYLAQYSNGKIKRKGAYEHSDLDWNQNFSMLVAPKVAEKVLLENVNIRRTVENWPDKYDFMKRVRLPRKYFLTIEHPEVWGDTQFPLQNTTRYYVAQNGGQLYKWMPPLKNKTKWRKNSIESGWGVQVCNGINEPDQLPIDYDYYIQEVEKLVLRLS